MPSSRVAVASSPLVVQEEMSPAPTNTGSLPGEGVVVVVGVGVGVGVAVPGGPATKPGTQTGPFVTVPLTPLPDESATEVPEPSFIPQRPIRPDEDETSMSLVAPISACVRAKFQMRASSRTPLKKPAATPVESKA